MGSLEKWACREMENLGIPDPGDIVRYLQPIENPTEVEEYMISMLDVTQASHRKFIEGFLKKQEEARTAVDSRFYRKPDLEDNQLFKVADNKKKQKGTKENGMISKTSANGKGQENIKPNIPNISPNATAPHSTGSSTGKKKSKFVSLYSSEGKNKDVVLLSGRHRCDCQASKHKLINNCLKCGRIICEQEGSGPCPFCRNLVATNEEVELLEHGSRKSEALQKRLFSEKNALIKEGLVSSSNKQSDGLRRAVEHKNKLLEFDQTSEKRTKVYDDESDYFNTSSRWLSQEQKMKLEKREEEIRQKKYDRRNQKVTIDLLGRRVVEEEVNEGLYDPEDPIVKEILEGRSKDIFSAPDREESGPCVKVERPEYVETNATSSKRFGSKKFSGLTMRIQDREMQEMVDEGMCISMHQPWASLLVAGIKKHEGRTWYSSHRGRLWIAAAAKVPTELEISQLEQQYTVLLKDDCIDFPEHYPASCLLGCVDVISVLPQEEYRVKYPEGESDSPYVFVCESPQEMVLKFPMKGEHKIYKMDPKIHQAARKALRPREES